MQLISRGPYHLGPLLQLPDVTGVATKTWELGAYTLRETNMAPETPGLENEFLFGKAGAILVLDVLDSFR